MILSWTPLGLETSFLAFQRPYIFVISFISTAQGRSLLTDAHNRIIL